MNTLRLDLEDIIDNQDLITHFQPLVSVKTGAMLALEALSRGRLREPDLIVPPNLLFGLARDHDQRLRLDRACRAKAFKAFAPMHARRKELLLSINLDASLVKLRNASSKFTMDAATAAGIKPANVVIEILESRVADEAALADFIATYRDLGFLIALDDVGSGHSNLDRIPLYAPDIIKIDRGLISGIHAEHRKRITVESLVRLARGVGSLVVAEGVEEAEEVLTLMEMGVDVFQGFYFSRPGPVEADHSDLAPITKRMAAMHSKRTVTAINERIRRHESYTAIMDMVLTDMEDAHTGSYDHILVETLGKWPELECLYVLDRRGRQVSSTMCSPDAVSERHRLIYQPAPPGADHSLKEYYLPLKAGLPRFTTEPYISLASGNLCTTISAWFTDAGGRGRVLCVDIKR